MNDLGLGVVISMKDMFTQNAARVQSAMTSLDASVAAASERMSRNLDRIQKGTMMIGAGLAMMAVPSALIASTAATQKALAEMSSLGTKDLRTLEDAAESFTNQWAGYSKAEFIGAAYDVKSALANLSDEAVGTFSAMAALTAKATKASIQDMVGTFTTGYGIFKPIMSEMNDIEWAQAFSGAMAQTVAAFKTTGPQMAEAIKNVGATAAASNIPLQEQLAILGQLQTTMPGSEAGTLYKAFIMKAAEAGEELKLSFIDASGRLKGILPILQELKTKFPDLSQAAAQVEIKKAFGSDEAVKFVLQMSQGMDALEGNIKGIAKAMKGGTAVTLEMARAMNMDIGSQLAVARQQLSNLFEILGGTLLPVVTPLIQGVSRVIVFFQKLARAVPFLTGAALTLSMALGAVLVVVGGAIAAAGTMGLMLPAISAGFAAIGTTLAGVGSAVAAWFWPVTLTIAGVILAVYLLRRAWTSNFGGIRDVVVGVWDRVKLVFEGIRALTSSLSGGVGQMSADLAQKLEAAGLMGLVTTVFRVYYRVRQFLVGLGEAFAHAFGRIRQILEPAVRSLLSAYGVFYGALFSVFKALGLVSTAVDGSSFRSLGSAIGTVLGVILQVGAYILRFIITPLSWVVHFQALIVRAVTWTLGVIVQGVSSAAKFIYQFCLPVRLVAQAFIAAGRIARGVWQILTGDGSLFAGLKAIGAAVLDFLTEPFRWARDVVQATWNFLSSSMGGLGRLFAALGRTILNVFLNLPLVRLMRAALAGVRQLLSGDVSLYEAGRALIASLGQGILSLATYPATLLKNLLQRLCGLLSGDASFSAAGGKIVRGLANGMLSVLGLPGTIIGAALRGIIGVIQGAWPTLTALGQALLGALAAPFPALVGLVSSIWNGISAVVQTGWQGLQTVAAGVLSAITAGIQGLLGQLGRMAVELGSLLANVFSGAWNALVAGGQGAMAAAQAVFGGTFSAGSVLAEGLGQIVGGIASAWGAAFTFIQGAASATWNAIRESAAGAWEALRGGLAQAGELAGKAASGAKQVAGAAWDKTKSLTSGLWDSVRSAASGAMQRVQTGLGARPQPVKESSTQPVPTAPMPATVALTPAIPAVPVSPVAPTKTLMPPVAHVPKMEPLPRPIISVAAQAEHSVTLMPKVDTSLIPALFRATLLLTPTLAAALPAPAPMAVAVRPAPEREIAHPAIAPPMTTSVTRPLAASEPLPVTPPVERASASFQPPAPIAAPLSPPPGLMSLAITGRILPQLPELSPLQLPVRATVQLPRATAEAPLSLRPTLPTLDPLEVPGLLRMVPPSLPPALGVSVGIIEPA